MLQISSEEGHAVCRKLGRIGIIDIIEDPFTIKLSVADHLAIEKLPREKSDKDALARELEAFKAKKQDMDKKAESLQAELERKKKAMFSDLEEKLKKSLNKGA